MSIWNERLDAELGELVRRYRLASGLSQVDLGDGAGISYQQIQKYESGANKISVSRLFAVAAALKISPSQLLRELEGRIEGRIEGAASVPAETVEFLASRRGQQVVRAMALCDDPKLLDAFVDLFLSASSTRSRTNGDARQHSVSGST